MTGMAFKVVVIYPEAKKNIYLSIGMVHTADSGLGETTYSASVFLGWVGHASASLLVWVRLLTQPLLTLCLKPHSVNMQPVGQKENDSQKCCLPQPRKTCGREFSLLYRTVTVTCQMATASAAELVKNFLE